MANRIDDLSKALATGVPRRHALRLAVVSVAGGVLGVLSAKEASAAPNECSVFCSFAAPAGPARASCKQACRKCGPEGVCVELTSLGIPSSFFCCAEGETCCPGLGCCPEGTVCTAEGCVAL
jgi:hypothetical protein